MQTSLSQCSCLYRGRDILILLLSWDLRLSSEIWCIIMMFSIHSLIRSILSSNLVCSSRIGRHWARLLYANYHDILYIIKKKVWFYIALYPVHWTAQSALHFPPLADLFIPTPFSASLGSILAMQQLRNDYSLTFPPLSIVRYSFIQLSRLRRREVKENAQTSKRYQRGFEPGLSRLRVRHSTTEPPRLCCTAQYCRPLCLWNQTLYKYVVLNFAV